MSLTSTSCGFATDSGYGSFGVGIVGETLWDAGIGFSFEANNTYLNVKAPITLAIVPVIVLVVGTTAALSTAVVAIVILITDFSGSEGDYYE